jgi:hypothetical protein
MHGQEDEREQLWGRRKRGIDEVDEWTGGGRTMDEGGGSNGFFACAIGISKPNSRRGGGGAWGIKNLNGWG